MGSFLRFGTGRALMLLSVFGIVTAMAAAHVQAATPGTNGRIAYSRFADRTFRHADIVSVNPDGSGVMKLTSAPAGTYDFNPDWSPDGTRIAFQRSGASGDFVYTMNADGSDLRRITFSSQDADPAWSPDGSRIAVEHFDASTGIGGLYTLSASGGDYILVIAHDALGEKMEPQWSPDRTKLVFQIVSDTNGSAIFTVNLDGTGQRQITPFGFGFAHPDWSPDGRLIVFENYTDGAPQGVSTNVFTVHPDGTHLTQVSHLQGGALNATNPAWSPDGTRIVFVEVPGSGHFGYADVYTMQADGTDVRQVTNSLFWDFRPSWGSER